ncbi:FAD-dependent oxidoreductase [Solwaraspora sp. WMMB335]|uniref:FAD-dependent oxidoreductase n=1 Tax=Solwaraspora sp. WMMB335 TaxID=3404118 RepID=UPI003B950E34
MSTGSVPGRLAQRLDPTDVAVTVVNAEPDFVERVRMHQLATGQDLKPRPLRDMFAGTGVDLRIATVTGVLGYDTLVYALGSSWNPGAVPGRRRVRRRDRRPTGALRLRDRLTRLAAGRSVVVVGGGLTGLEAATEIAEARPDLDVALADGGTIPAAVTVWTAGFAVPTITRTTALTLAATGQVANRCGCRAPRACRPRGRSPTRSPPD